MPETVYLSLDRFSIVDAPPTTFMSIIPNQLKSVPYIIFYLSSVPVKRRPLRIEKLCFIAMAVEEVKFQRKKKGKSFLQKAKKFGKQGQRGRGSQIAQVTKSGVWMEA